MTESHFNRTNGLKQVANYCRETNHTINITDRTTNGDCQRQNRECRLLFIRRINLEYFRIYGGFSLRDLTIVHSNRLGTNQHVLSRMISMWSTDDNSHRQLLPYIFVILPAFAHKNHILFGQFFSVKIMRTGGRARGQNQKGNFTWILIRTT